MRESIGSTIKAWRKHYRYSQLQLAVELEISSKHISFIETGKSIPSKNMILKIATFLCISKGETNRALCLAGYAPMFADLPVTDKNLKPIFDAIEIMVQNHMPYPALVLNNNWDVVMLNASAKKLLGEIGYSEYTNLLEALIADTPEKSKIINWHEAVSGILTRLKQEMNVLGNHEHLQKYETQLNNSLLSSKSYCINNNQDIMLSTKIKLKESVLSFFSTVAQLSTVQDITLSEYRIELMFPSDELTKDYYMKNLEKSSDSL